MRSTSESVPKLICRLLDALMARGWLDHALVSSVFVISRLALLRAGLKFNFTLGWMFLADPADLRERLLETVLNFHAYPPGMNLITGMLLKLGGSHTAGFAHLSFCICGLVLANSLLYLLRACGLSLSVRCALSIAFLLTPPCLYFENLYLYEAPVAALLCLATVFLHRALLEPASVGRWFLFFVTCAVIGWIRSTFHLIWFAGLTAFAVWAAGSGARRFVAAAAVFPALLLLSLYLKNYARFGVFGAASSGTCNLAHVTVMRLPPEERAAWIADGKLSPFANISVYASPREYLPYFPSSRSERWPEQLNELDRPSLGEPNYNHWFFLEAAPARGADARYYMAHHFRDYLQTVKQGFIQIFEPSTVWFPHDQAENSPHHQHRQILGRYEKSYNRLVHGLFWPPFGMYLLLLPGLLWAAVRGFVLVRSGDRAHRALGGTLLFCTFTVIFVVLLSSAVTIGESSRYRYQIEAMLWVIGALGCTDLIFRVSHLLGVSRASRPSLATPHESSAK